MYIRLAHRLYIDVQYFLYIFQQIYLSAQRQILQLLANDSTVSREKAKKTIRLCKSFQVFLQIFSVFFYKSFQVFFRHKTSAIHSIFTVDHVKSWPWSEWMGRIYQSSSKQGFTSFFAGIYALFFFSPQLLCVVWNQMFIFRHNWRFWRWTSRRRRWTKTRS